jgi:hypothetical protein
VLKEASAVPERLEAAEERFKRQIIFLRHVTGAIGRISPTRIIEILRGKVLKFLSACAVLLLVATLLGSALFGGLIMPIEAEAESADNNKGDDAHIYGVCADA